MINPIITTINKEVVVSNNHRFYSFKFTLSIANNNNYNVKCNYYVNGEYVDYILINANTSQTLIIDNLEEPYNSFYCDFISADFLYTICPNMSWNTPTLREVLNDLCLVNDCLITLQDNVLKPYSIGTKGSNFDSDKINYVYKSQSLDEYASELQSNLGNAIDHKNSKRSNFIGYKNNETAYFSTANVPSNGKIKIELSRPIIEITKFNVIVQIGGGNAVIKDMLDYVCEKSIFDTKLQGRESTYDNDGTPNIQRNCVYYTRGEKTIEGFTNEYEYFVLISTLKDTPIERWQTIMGLPGNVNLNNWMFEIEYTSVGKQTYRISRGTNYKSKRNYRVAIDNQDNSMVNVERFTNLEKQKLNRLSNKAVLISQPHSQFNELANLSQTYTNKYVIFSKNIIINKRTIDAEYYATENYVLQNYFTSIRSYKRNFEWIDYGKAVERNEIKKVYYELSFNRNNDQVIDLKYMTTATELYTKFFAISPFIDTSNYIGFCYDDARNIKINTSEGNTFIYTNKLCINGNLQAVNNIVSYTLQLDDNVFAGYQSIWNNYEPTTSHATDYDGEHVGDISMQQLNEYMQESLHPVSAFYNKGINYNSDTTYNTFNYLYVQFGGHTKQDENYCTLQHNILDEYSQIYPYNTLTNAQNSEGLNQQFYFKYYKDNAEKLGLTFNFEWVSDNEDLVILDNIAENSLYEKMTTTTENYSIYNKYTYLNNCIDGGVGVFGRGEIGYVYWYPLTDIANMTNAQRSFIWNENNLVVNNFPCIYYSDGAFYMTADLNWVVNYCKYPADYNNRYLVYDFTDNKFKLCKTKEATINRVNYYVIDINSGVELQINTKMYVSDIVNNNKFGIYEVESINTSDRYIYTEEIVYEANYPLNTTYATINTFGVKGSTKTNLTANINLNNGQLFIANANNNYDYIVVNDSLRINNINSHLNGANLVLYLKIKDYFI